MAVTPTTNKSFELVTVGTESGTWGPYVNGNASLLDNLLGSVATVALTNVNVALSSAQYQNYFIKFTGAITGNIQITFPGGVGGFWTILNATTNSSTQYITINTTAAGTTVIGLPPGQNTKIGVDGTSPFYEHLPHHVGQYWHHGGSSVPAWVSNCTVPPYLNCDGTTFTAATYPALNSFLSGNTLPDARGRVMAALDQGTGRNGLSFLQSSGFASQSITVASSHLPAHSHPISDPTHTHPLGSAGGDGFFTGSGHGFSGFGQVTNSAATGITVSNSTYANSAISFGTLPPIVAHGLTLIRAG
jgi:hypothetical protein